MRPHFLNPCHWLARWQYSHAWDVTGMYHCSGVLGCAFSAFTISVLTGTCALLNSNFIDSMRTLARNKRRRIWKEFGPAESYMEADLVQQHWWYGTCFPRRNKFHHYVCFLIGWVCVPAVALPQLTQWINVGAELWSFSDTHHSSLGVSLVPVCGWPWHTGAHRGQGRAWDPPKI